MLRKITAVIILILLSSCAKKTEVVSYIKITANEAVQIMDSETDYILLDVRTGEEFRESRIEGALLLPYDEIEEKALSEIPEKDLVILVYCRTGRRSEIASCSLIDLGYTKVYDMGGIVDWELGTTSG